MSSKAAESTVIVRRKVFVKDLELPAYIGVYDEEQGVSQPVIINLELDVYEPDDPISDSIENVVCYNKMTQGVKDIIAQGHIRLVETLAEKIADLAFSHDLVLSALIRVEKPNAIGEAKSAGVEILRKRP